MIDSISWLENVLLAARFIPDSVLSDIHYVPNINGVIKNVNSNNYLIIFILKVLTVS